MQIGDNNESLVRWVAIGVPLLTFVGGAALLILRAAVHLSLSAALIPVAILVGIQLAIYVVMFWVRRRFRRTHDPRIAIAVVGFYCLVMGIVVFHYAHTLRLMIIERSDYVTFSLAVLFATVVVVAVSPKWHFSE